MATHHERRMKAQTHNNEPTMTDQSQRDSTDLNVIVRNIHTTGTLRGNPNEPMEGDFSELPRDLRDMIELTREMGALRKRLPGALAEKPVDELLTLTHEEIQTILQPPAQPPAEEKTT